MGRPLFDADFDGVDPVRVKSQVFPDCRYGCIGSLVGPDGVDRAFPPSRNAVIGAQKKALGVCAGPSDFVFVSLCCQRGSGVTFIEMKLPGCRQTPEQLDFEAKVKSRGHEYHVCFSFVEFQKLIKRKIANYERGPLG